MTSSSRGVVCLLLRCTSCTFETISDTRAMAVPHELWNIVKFGWPSGPCVDCVVDVEGRLA